MVNVVLSTLTSFLINKIHGWLVPKEGRTHLRCCKKEDWHLSETYPYDSTTSFCLGVFRTEHSQESEMESFPKKLATYMISNFIKISILHFLQGFKDVTALVSLSYL